MSDLIDRQAAIDARDGRIFQEIVVEYPSYNPYPEYKGKPYFSIKYIENGQEFIGYGTYSQAVLSEYLKKYFMPSAERKGKWIDMGDFEQCSVCTGTNLKAVNTVYGKAIWIKSAYCPNCGASMEGGEEDAD